MGKVRFREQGEWELLMYVPFVGPMADECEVTSVAVVLGLYWLHIVCCCGTGTPFVAHLLCGLHADAFCLFF